MFGVATLTRMRTATKSVGGVVYDILQHPCPRNVQQKTNKHRKTLQTKQLSFFTTNQIY